MRAHRPGGSLTGLSQWMAAGACAMLAGCASIFAPDPCVDFKSRTDRIDKDVAYSFAAAETRTAARDFRSLPNGQLAAARMYRLWVDQENITPCQFLIIKSEFYLQRVGGGMRFEEVREFYTKDGFKITENHTDVSPSLSRTGFYLGRAPLPIPATAPAGSYRIVGKLYLRTAANRRSLLAEASTEFDVKQP